MKKSMFVSVILVLFSTIVEVARADRAGQISEIDDLMTAWHRAAAEADEETYFGLMAPGAMFLGTDVSERWTREEFREWAASRFEGDSAWIYRAEQRNIHVGSEGTFAWLDEDLASESYWTCRGTAVLEKIEGRWKIRHYSLTFTIPNSAVPDIKPVVLREINKDL